MSQIAHCDSCNADHELSEIETRASKNEGFPGHRPTRCWCPKCGAVIPGLAPEEVEVANPKAWFIVGGLLALLGMLAIVPKTWFEPMGLLILSGIGLLGIIFGEVKHKIWSALLVGGCVYLAYELPKIT